MVVANFGVVSGTGVFRPDSAGVEVRRTALVVTEGSAVAASECRDGGREMTGGVDSILGTTDARRALEGRFGELGGESEDMVDDCSGKWSLSGIF